MLYFNLFLETCYSEIYRYSKICASKNKYHGIVGNSKKIFWEDPKVYQELKYIMAWNAIQLVEGVEWT